MNPSIEDRLSSVVRALTDIIMPALPAEAALAREQSQLAIGHLQIILAQIPTYAAYQAEERSDAVGLARDLVAAGAGTFDAATIDALDRAAAGDDDAVAINAVISAALRQLTPGSGDRIGAIVVAHQDARSAKDRQCFSAMGFDAGITA